jgi:hypothetical protein
VASTPIDPSHFRRTSREKGDARLDDLVDEPLETFVAALPVVVSEPEVVLASDEVKRRRHMDQDVDVSRVHPGVARAARPARSARSPSKMPPSARLCLR